MSIPGAENSNAGGGASEISIRLADVHLHFAAPVLNGVTLSIRRGELFGLIGPGAAGKSLVLKLIAGLLKPQRGAVEVEGRPVHRLDEIDLGSLRQSIGMLFQNNALFDFMSVGDNVAFPLLRQDLPREEILHRVTQRLERVGLAGFESRSVQGLSGGQKKRVGIARASVTRPPILLYDEPAAGLDPVTSQKIFDLLRAEQLATRATAVMVSSDLPRLLPVCDRIGMMLDGRLIFQGTQADAEASSDRRIRQFLRGDIEGPL